MTTRLLSIMLVLAFSVCPGFAAAQGGRPAKRSREQKQQGREYFERGSAYYQVSEYEKAIAEFQKSYDLTDDPALLYNIGRCHEEMGNAEQAVGYYSRYLAKSPNASDASEVRDRIDRIEKTEREKTEADQQRLDGEKRRQEEDERRQAEEAQRQADQAAKAEAERKREEAEHAPASEADHVFDGRLGFFGEFTDNLPNAFVLDSNYFVPMGAAWDFVVGLVFQSFGENQGLHFNGYGVNLAVRKLWILSDLISIDLRFGASPLYMHARKTDALLLPGRASSRLGFRVDRYVVVLVELAPMVGPFFNFTSDTLDISIAVEGLAGVEIWLFL